MSVEEPVGFGEDGRLITAIRFTETEIADIYMGSDLYAASPDGKAQIERALDGLPSFSFEVDGFLGR